MSSKYEPKTPEGKKRMAEARRRWGKGFTAARCRNCGKGSGFSDYCKSCKEDAGVVIESNLYVDKRSSRKGPG